MFTPPIFQDGQGNPTLECSICVFMDILGFVELQSSAEKDGTESQLFNRVHKSIKTKLSELNDNIVPNGKWKLKVFTDNIILGYPIRFEHHEDVISSIAECIANYQLGMAKDGFFVRGGLALGNLFMDEHIAYGQALIESYKLESKSARDPRIIVSKTIQKLIIEHFGYYAYPEMAPQNDIFKLDTDGQIFINYLYPCFEEMAHNAPADIDSLTIHKSHIEDGLRTITSPTAWAKYSWLANYHDSCILNYMKGAGENLLISSDIHRKYPVNICPAIIAPRIA
jgi:hypothetical protein